MLWSKLLHVFSMVLWMGGLLMLTQMLAWQVRQPAELQERLHPLTRRLFWAATVPGLVLTWVFGLALVGFKPHLFQQGWFHGKLGLAVLLTILTLMLGGAVRRVGQDPGPHHQAARYKALHGLTSLFLLGILVSLYIFGTGA